jgi:hypothetical protein
MCADGFHNSRRNVLRLFLVVNEILVGDSKSPASNHLQKVLKRNFKPAEIFHFSNSWRHLANAMGYPEAQFIVSDWGE